MRILFIYKIKGANILIQINACRYRLLIIWPIILKPRNTLSLTDVTFGLHPILFVWMGVN